MSRYDAIVVGGGTSGGVVLWDLHRSGMKVALIERELLGGLCAYWGCMPSKTLLRPGEIGWEAHHGFGVSPVDLDWPAVASYRDSIVRDWNDERQVAELRDAGIDFFRGDATITGSGRIQVNGHALQTDRIVVATGSEASVPPIPGLKEVGYWTNREATALHVIPESVLVLGGGAVGCELGEMLHTFGAKVTIVEATPQLLGRENSDAAGHLQKRYEAIGINLFLGRSAAKVGRKGDARTVTLDDGEQLSAEIILVATGRHARTSGLGLETIGIEPTKQGIPVDRYCRAGENVWAIGDVTGVAGFTHVADYQGQIVSADIQGRSRPANYDAIPRVTYTNPEVAAVGMTDSKSAPAGMDLIEAQVELDAASRTPTYGQGYMGGLHLFGDRNERVLVGAWAVGPLAGEWIQWATLAIRGRVPLDVLQDTILAFPTFTRLYYQPVMDLVKQL